jgi:hypothetical protein
VDFSFAGCAKSDSFRLNASYESGVELVRAGEGLDVNFDLKKK